MMTDDEGVQNYVQYFVNAMYLRIGRSVELCTVVYVEEKSLKCRSECTVCTVKLSKIMLQTIRTKKCDVIKKTVYYL